MRIEIGESGCNPGTATNESCTITNQSASGGVRERDKTRSACKSIAIPRYASGFQKNYFNADTSLRFFTSSMIRPVT
jgi:hypothetical protein